MAIQQKERGNGIGTYEVKVLCQVFCMSKLNLNTGERGCVLPSSHFRYWVFWFK